MLKSCEKRYRIYLQVMFLLFLIDILSKYFFMNKYYFENFLIGISYSENRGSAFSMFSNVEIYNILIILLSIIVLIYLVWYLREFKNKSLIQYSAICFLITGILGNLYDRIVFGFVRDFISLKYLFIFNLADLYLTIGILIFIYSEFTKK